MSGNNDLNPLQDDENINNIDENNKNKKNKKNKKQLIIIFIIIFLLLFFIIYGAINLIQKYNQTPHDGDTVTTTVENTSDDLIENPIDFESLQEDNEDIYAWITINDTKIDYPIVQHPTDDSFYLKHRAEDKAYTIDGAIYTEMANTKTFNDRVTVIYGHNLLSGEMFATLHYFEKEDFFESHPYFYIYTQNHKFTYQIVSAFKYDNRHILNSFNFADTQVFTEFLDMIQNPDSVLKNVRTSLDVELDENSKIVALSTCIGQSSSRYLVFGVLVKDEKTY